MLRAFTENDLDSIMNLWLETNIATHSFIEEDHWKNNYEAVKQMIPNATIFIYEENGAVVGFVGLIGIYIAGIFIKANLQSKGFGKSLLNCIKGQKTKLQLQVYKKTTRQSNFILERVLSFLTNRLMKTLVKWSLL